MRIKLYSAIAFLIAIGAALAYAPLHLSAWALGPSDVIGPLVEYTDDVFHFAISYPAGYIVREYAEDDDGAPRCVPDIRRAVCGKRHHARTDSARLCSLTRTRRRPRGRSDRDRGVGRSRRCGRS